MIPTHAIIQPHYSARIHTEQGPENTLGDRLLTTHSSTLIS